MTFGASLTRDRENDAIIYVAGPTPIILKTFLFVGVVVAYIKTKSGNGFADTKFPMRVGHSISSGKGIFLTVNFLGAKTGVNTKTVFKSNATKNLGVNSIAFFIREVGRPCSETPTVGDSGISKVCDKVNQTSK